MLGQAHRQTTPIYSNKPGFEKVISKRIKPRLAGITGTMLVGMGLCASLPVAALEEIDEAYFDEVPVVLSASRLAQSRQDVPIATTIIDRQMIEASGFTEIPDLLRLVPGILVEYDTGHIQAVGNHLLNDRFSRRMQVLVDGRSVYSPAFGGVHWTQLPVTIDDIERIEVVRGPNAASYGSNAFTGTVSIITRHASQDRGTSVRVNAGSYGLREGFVRYGGQHQDLDYRLSVAYREDDGFEERHDDKGVSIFTARADYQVNLTDTVTLDVGLNNSDIGMDNVFDSLVPEYERSHNSRYAQFKWQRVLADGEEIYTQFYFNGYDDNNSYLSRPIAGLGGAQIPINEDIESDRYDLEFQHTLPKMDNGLQLVWGGSYRHDKVTTDVFLGSNSPGENDTWRLFSSAAWHLSERLQLNAGLMYENSDIGGSDLSPRLGMNIHVMPGHTIRLAASRATRIPTQFEQLAEWFIEIPAFGINDLVVYNAMNVEPEEIIAFELGYFAQFGNRLTADMRIYREELDDLIGVRTGDFPTDIDVLSSDLFFDNIDEATIEGFELELDYRPDARNRFAFSYAYTDIDATDLINNVNYSGSAPNNNISLLAMHDFDHGVSGSLSWYYVGEHKQLGNNQQQDSTSRVDVRLAKRIKTSSIDGELALVVQNVFDDHIETRLRSVVDRRGHLSFRMKY